MSARPSILHADVDSFFASVEQRDDPALRGRPVIVGPGVVLAASYEAKAYGVRSGMGGRQARRLCPQAVVVESHFDAYTEASRDLFEVFREIAPTVEGVSMEEAFLDVSGLERISGTPADIAVCLRREVRERVGLPISVGAATGRAIAKVASRVAKPDGLLVIEPGDELTFLHPLRVELLWGVGPATARRLHRRGIVTIGDLARRSEQELVATLGRAGGRRLHALARDRRARPVPRRAGRRSVGAQSALGRATTSAQSIDAVLLGLVDRVTRRLRAAGRAGRTVVLRLRFGDFSRGSRSRRLPHPTAATAPVLAAARRLLAAATPEIELRGLTLLGITVSELTCAPVQLELPLPGCERVRLDAALDELRERFGAGAITRATLVGRGRGFEARLLAAERPARGREVSDSPRPG